jgi:hypothetical protein
VLSEISCTVSVESVLNLPLRESREKTLEHSDRDLWAVLLYLLEQPLALLRARALQGPPRCRSMSPAGPSFSNRLFQL